MTAGRGESIFKLVELSALPLEITTPSLPSHFCGCFPGAKFSHLLAQPSWVNFTMCELSLPRAFVYPHSSRLLLGQRAIDSSRLQTRRRPGAMTETKRGFRSRVALLKVTLRQLVSDQPTNIKPFAAQPSPAQPISAASSRVA